MESINVRSIEDSTSSNVSNSKVSNPYALKSKISEPQVLNLENFNSKLGLFSIKYYLIFQ